MKQPKSTRNKSNREKFDFKKTAVEEDASPKKRKMTTDEIDDQPGKLTDRKHKRDQDKLNISSESSQEDMKESSTNTFGFVPRNNLSAKKFGKALKFIPSLFPKILTSKLQTNPSFISYLL